MLASPNPDKFGISEDEIKLKKANNGDKEKIELYSSERLDKLNRDVEDPLAEDEEYEATELDKQSEYHHAI